MISLTVSADGDKSAKRKKKRKEAGLSADISLTPESTNRQLARTWDFMVKKEAVSSVRTFR